MDPVLTAEKSWQFFRTVFTTLSRFLEVPKHSDASPPQPNGGHSSQSRCPHRVNLVSIFELPHGETRTCPDSQVFECIPSAVAVADHPGLKTCIGKDKLKLRWNLLEVGPMYQTRYAKLNGACLLSVDLIKITYITCKSKGASHLSGEIRPKIKQVATPWDSHDCWEPPLLGCAIFSQQIDLGITSQACWPLARVGSTWRLIKERRVDRKNTDIVYHIFSTYVHI